MDAKHTPEPWTHTAVEGGWDGVAGDGQVICRLGLNNPANAARIVACVNAMAGIEDPAAFVAALRKSHWRLVEALELAQEWLANCVPSTAMYGSRKPLPVIAAALAAIPPELLEPK